MALITSPRYLVNDACVLLNKPTSTALSGLKAKQQYLTTKVAPTATSTTSTRYGSLPAEGGVLGVLCGIIGTIQATETIKIILGQGTTLSGRLMLYNAWI